MNRLPWFILQHHQYGIGNFINCTPAIKRLFLERGQPIPVLFQRPEVAAMFEDWDAIQAIGTKEEIHGRRVLFSSEMCNQLTPDWEYIYRRVTHHEGPVPHTYVDNPGHKFVGTNINEGDYVVVARGCHADNHVEMKDPGDETYRKILDWIAPHKKIAFIGTTKDWNRNMSRMKEWFPESITILNDMRSSLSAISGCSFLLSNDTGMYHVAAAMGKPAFVMWKDTNFNKNRAPGRTCFFSFRDWTTDFIRFSRWTPFIPEVEE